MSFVGPCRLPRMTFVDLTPATRRMAALLDGLADDSLDRPTPCPEYRLGDLVEHVGGLAQAFAAAARKATDDPVVQQAGRATRRASATTGARESRETSTRSRLRGATRRRGPA